MINLSRYIFVEETKMPNSQGNENLLLKCRSFQKIYIELVPFDRFVFLNASFECFEKWDSLMRNKLSFSFSGSHFQTGHEWDMAGGYQWRGASHPVSPTGDPKYSSGATARSGSREYRRYVILL